MCVYIYSVFMNVFILITHVCILYFYIAGEKSEYYNARYFCSFQLHLRITIVGGGPKMAEE